MYYLAFNYGPDMFVVKIDAGEEMKVVRSVNVKFHNETDYPYKDIHVPRFLVEDPSDENFLFLMGQYQYQGSIIRLQKSSLRSTWMMQFNEDYAYEVVTDATDTDPTLFS
jgi:hypothetical protein